MKKLSLILVSAMVLLASCSATKGTVKMTVASEKRWAMGVAPMEVLLVKEDGSKDWGMFYSGIEGFTYEKGYEYVLEVKKEEIEKPIPADASSVRYILVKELSKTQKMSENMPKGMDAPAKYTWTARVIGIEDADVGVGGAKGKFPVKVVELEVTALNSTGISFKESDTIHAELVAEPKVMPEVGKEYVFKAKESHPAHTLGVYMLETDAQELIR